MMNKGCWKLDENDEAVFIDIDDEGTEDAANKIYSRWSELPNLLLEKIFSYLSIREKFYTSLVCKSWHDAFYQPYVWYRFALEDTTLTRGRYNYYTGWQYILDHLRTQQCLTQVGKKFRYLIFEPMMNFHNLYEFMRIISWYMEQSQRENFEMKGVGCKIHSLKFTFPCDMNTREESERPRLFGTGGDLLKGLKRLLKNLGKLRRLELFDLMLESREAQHLLDEVCDVCYLSLRKLVLINATKFKCQILHVGIFLNLQVLMLSPQNIGDDMIELIGDSNVKHLHIIQNRYTPSDSAISPVSVRAWRNCKKSNPQLCVHIQMEGTKDKKVAWQPYAPVKTVLYDSRYMKFSTDDTSTTIDLYKNCLRVYGFTGMPRYYMEKSFKDRIDSMMVYMCRQCAHLHTLIIRERISTSTILLIAYTAKNLQYLHIRRNAVILRCEWQQNPEWSDEFYTWLKINSRSYDLLENEVSQILGYKWRMLADREFKFLPLNLYVDD